jgi:hypothetical protein
VVGKQREATPPLIRVQDQFLALSGVEVFFLGIAGPLKNNHFR